MTQTQKLRDNTRKLELYLANISQTGCGCNGISIGQCFSMVEIGRRPGISVKDLATVLNSDKSSVSRTVEDLVQKGMIERKPSQEDRRYVVLNLTEKGNEIFCKIEENMNERFKHILETIPAEKRDMVIEALELYNTALENENADNKSEINKNAENNPRANKSGRECCTCCNND